MDFELVFKELNSQHVRYIVVGGIAVNLHGFVRATADLDLLIALDRDNVLQFVSVVKKLGWKPRVPVKLEQLAEPQERDAWVKDKGMKAFAVYNPKMPLEHVDVLVDTPFDFEKVFGKRKMVSFGKMKVPVVAIEDLIRMKEYAGRPQDLADLIRLRQLKKMADEA